MPVKLKRDVMIEIMKSLGFSMTNEGNPDSRIQVKTMGVWTTLGALEQAYECGVTAGALARQATDERIGAKDRKDGPNGEIS